MTAPTLTPKGQAAKFAYDPQVLVLFINAKSEYVSQTREIAWRGKTRNQKATVRLLNGKRFDQTDDARMVLRWRNAASAVSKGGAERFLARYDLTTDTFERWARAKKLKPVLWDRTNKETR